MHQSQIDQLAILWNKTRDENIERPGMKRSEGIWIMSNKDMFDKATR